MSDERESPREAVYRHVSGRVLHLQDSYLSGYSTGTRQLAELRRAATQAPGAYAPTWELEFEGMPESLRGRGPRPSDGEWAAHVALTLYAVHQQSQEAGMHQPGADHGLGSAIRRLVLVNPERYANLELGEPPRRFAALVSAQSMGEVAHYLRQIVQLLRASAIPLDYGRLAQDVLDLQNPYRADGVRLAWGRDFARFTTDETATEQA